MKKEFRVLNRGFRILILAGVVCLAGETFGAGVAVPRDQAVRAVEKMVSGAAGADLQVLRQAGTDDLPMLQAALAREDTLPQRVYASAWAKLPGWLASHLPEPTTAEACRANAASLVGQLGPVAKSAIPGLIRLLKDDEADGNAAISLGEMGAEAAEAVPALIDAVREQRPFAATALAKIGPAARAARPFLEEARRSGPVWLRHESELALRKLPEQRLAAPPQKLAQQ